MLDILAMPLDQLPNDFPTQTPHESFMQRFVSARKGRTLLVGSKVYPGREDRRKRYKDALGIDMLEGEGVDIVHDLEHPLPPSLGLFDHIECWSVLEHSKRPWLVAQHLQDVMVAGATVHLTVPFIWRVHGYPNDYWRFTRAGVQALFERISWEELATGGDILRLHSDAVSALHRSDGSGPPYHVRTEVFGFGRRVATQ